MTATWVGTCQGDEGHRQNGPCHTFSLNAPGWGSSSVPHICTIRSDIDNATEQVRVDSQGPIPSRMATKADSEDAFKRDTHIVGECKPER